MSERYEKMSDWELLWEAIFKKIEEIGSELRQLKDRLKNILKRVLFFVLALAGISFGLIVLGSELENNSYIFYGKAGLMFISLVLLVLASPIGFAFSAQKYATFVRSFAVYQLFSVLVIWIAPLPVNFKILVALSLASLILALLNSVGEMRIVKVTTSLIFAVFIGVLFVPPVRDFFDKEMPVAKEPKLVKINKGDIASGKVRFFLDGKPAIWYFITPDGKYELFDKKGHHDIYRSSLKPINDYVVERLIANEELLAPRNRLHGWETQYAEKPSETPDQKLPLPETPPSEEKKDFPPPQTGEAQEKPPTQSESKITPFTPSPSAPRPETPKIAAVPVTPEVVPEKQPSASYCVLVIDSNFAEDRTLGLEALGWFEKGRAIYGYSCAPISFYEGKLSAQTLSLLSQKAEKVIVLRYENRLEAMEDNLKKCRSYVTLKIINTKSGVTVIDKEKHQAAVGISADKACQDSLDLALAATKREIQNNLGGKL